MNAKRIRLDFIPLENEDIRVRLRIGDRTFGRVCARPHNTIDHAMVIAAALLKEEKVRNEATIFLASPEEERTASSV